MGTRAIIRGRDFLRSALGAVLLSVAPAWGWTKGKIANDDGTYGGFLVPQEIVDDVRRLLETRSPTIDYFADRGLS